MTPEFLHLYSGLEREGPGEAADVLWALATAGTPPGARVLDAGAGSGADTVTLAMALPEARVASVEAVAEFTEAARARTAQFGERVTVWCGDMFAVPGTYDLIWSAGAAYFKGIAQALTAWKPALSPVGRIAFSEAVWMDPNPPEPLVEFWSEYAAMTDLAGTRARIAEAGFVVMGERIVAETAWQTYYAPIETRIGELRSGEVSPALAQVLDDAEVEIALRRQFGACYGYALFVVAPT